MDAHRIRASTYLLRECATATILFQIFSEYRDYNGKNCGQLVPNIELRLSFDFQTKITLPKTSNSLTISLFIRNNFAGNVNNRDLSLYHFDTFQSNFQANCFRQFWFFERQNVLFIIVYSSVIIFYVESIVLFLFQEFVVWMTFSLIKQVPETNKLVEYLFCINTSKSEHWLPILYLISFFSISVTRLEIKISLTCYTLKGATIQERSSEHFLT